VVGLANHTVLLARDGTEVPIADSGAPIRDQAGNLTGVVLAFRDQTEERLTQRLIQTRLSLIEYAANHSLEALLTRALDEVGAFVDSPIGFYDVVEPDQKTVFLQQWSTRTLEEFCRADGRGAHYGLDQAGVWVDCVRERGPVVHNDYASLPHKKGLPEGHAEVVRELVVPVMRNDQVGAILGVGNKPAEYTQKDVEIVSLLADVTWEIVERKRADEAFHTLSARHEAILTEIPDVVMVVDAGKVYTWANPAGYEFFGDDVIGREAEHYFEGEQETYGAVQPLFNGDTQTFYVESWQRRRDGQSRLLAWWCRALRDAEGRVVGAISTGRDITERNRAKEALRQSEEKFRAIFDHMAAACCLDEVVYRNGLPVDCRILDINPSYERILGIGKVQAVGALASELYELGEAPFLEVYAKVAETGEPAQFESYFAPIDKHLHVTVSCPAKGRFSTVFSDITDSKRAEEERTRLQAQLAHQQRLESLGTMGGGVAHEINNPDGESGHIAVRFFIEKDSEGRTVRTFGVNQDITGQKRAETELRQTNTLLREAFQELETSQRNLVQQERLRAFGEMASGVAHDFNNALSPILGYSELLLLSPETLEDREKAKGQIWIINTAARDAANVVRRLREFYRTREGDELFLPVDLNGLVEQAVDLAQPRWKDEAQSRGLDIAVETDLADVPLVSGIEPELREVLINLLFNGVDALKPEGGGKAHGALTVRTRAEDEHVAVEVSDTGAGMTPAVRERCLDPFFTTKGERGTGLGLSMVHGIVKRHGGTIAIDSELGRGTTFVLRFPVDTPTEAATVSLLDTAPARLLRVLVVDDEPALREMVKALLLLDGHAAETAVNGRAALEKFAPGAFDLVVTDRAMPEMGGDELAAALKELAPTQPILMLTGFSDMMDANEEKPAGVDRVLGKPPTLAAFRAAVVELTGR